MPEKSKFVFGNRAFSIEVTEAEMPGQVLGLCPEVSGCQVKGFDKKIVIEQVKRKIIQTMGLDPDEFLGKSDHIDGANLESTDLFLKSDPQLTVDLS